MLIVLIVVQVLAVLGLLVAWRADQALRTIQQDDPRTRAPTAAPTSARLPIAAAAPTATPGSRPEPNAPPAPIDTPAAPSTPPPAPELLRSPFNVLLIGVDRRPDEKEGARSDTLIVVRVDPVEKWASMLSIPRDTVAQIPRYGAAKVNAAYSYGYDNAEALYGPATAPEAGGAALAAETVESLLEITIDYTAQIDFHGFQQVVDAVGGVLIDVEKPLLDAEYPTEDYGVQRLFIPAGLQVLDGSTALAFARSRHASTDFDRSKRQQLVLRALLDEVRARGILENANLVAQLVALAEQNVRTTVPISQLGVIGGLARLARDIPLDRVTQLSINPNDVALVGESGSDLYWSRDDIAQLVERWKAGPAGAEIARVQVLNGSGVPGTATRVSALLSEAGFTTEAPDNAPQPYTRTTVIDYSGRPYTLRRLAATLGLNEQDVRTETGNDIRPASGADIVVIVGQDYINSR